MLAANTEPRQQNRLSVTGRQDRYLDTGREIILKYIQYDQNNNTVDVVLNSITGVYHLHNLGPGFFWTDSQINEKNIYIFLSNIIV